MTSETFVIYSVSRLIHIVSVKRNCKDHAVFDMMNGVVRVFVEFNSKQKEIYKRTVCRSKF